VIDPKEGGVITRTQNFCFSDSHKPFNISEQIFAGLTVKTTDSLSHLEKYQIPYGIIERLRQKEPFNKMTEIQIKELVDEFKKFVAIVNYEKGKKIEMVSELVDELWHTLSCSRMTTENSAIRLSANIFIMIPMSMQKIEMAPSSSLIKREILNFFMRNMKSTLDLRRLFGSRRFPKKILHRKP
jgi:hypothetical protein